MNVLPNLTLFQKGAASFFLGSYFLCGFFHDTGSLASEEIPPHQAAKHRGDTPSTHWSFELLAPGHPKSQSDWSKSPIDDYVKERLDAFQLDPSEPASRSDLLRRLYFQLTGLPPGADERKAFLEDESLLAANRLVDRLLESPHFGERWGRHWLDLARYADSNGLDENFLFREAWRYRNWVIQALNEDLPYDAFLLQQIAGDLLPYESIEQRDRQRIASGFLVVGPKVLLGINPDLQRMDVADEQVSTIGTTVLGLTIGCARCHDHKFEPIPTKDYYAMAGIFTSTQVMEQRYMLGQQRKMEQLVGLGVDGGILDAAYEKYWREHPSVKKAKDQAVAILKLLEQDDEAGFNKLLDSHATNIATEAKDVLLSKEKRVQAQKQKVNSLAKILNHPPVIPPRAMIPVDVKQPADESIRRAGQFDRLGDKVPRGFLSAVGVRQTSLPNKTSGRVELARWLTDMENGAGPLTARVLANRVWHHLIGQGLVRTVDNFGVTGEPPSHPELLDYLASRLVESGWSIKSLIREIVLSRTFAMRSQFQESGHRLDPENQWLWRAHRRRIDPESMRDAMFFAAGKLDLTPMDSSVWYLGDQATAVGANKNRRRTDFPNRSVYLPVIRNDLPEVFEVFDFTDPHVATGARPKTTVATQGLFMLNDAMVMELAEDTARRAISTPRAGRLDRVFESICNREPNTTERKKLLTFLDSAQEQLQEEQVEGKELKSWSMLCHAIFSLSRFHFIE
jgi:hypothetical protein